MEPQGYSYRSTGGLQSRLAAYLQPHHLAPDLSHHGSGDEITTIRSVVERLSNDALVSPSEFLVARAVDNLTTFLDKNRRLAFTMRFRHFEKLWGCIRLSWLGLHACTRILRHIDGGERHDCGFASISLLVNASKSPGSPALAVLARLRQRLADAIATCRARARCSCLLHRAGVISGGSSKQWAAADSLWQQIESQPSECAAAAKPDTDRRGESPAEQQEHLPVPPVVPGLWHVLQALRPSDHGAVGARSGKGSDHSSLQELGEAVSVPRELLRAATRDPPRHGFAFTGDGIAGRDFECAGRLFAVWVSPTGPTKANAPWGNLGPQRQASRVPNGILPPSYRYSLQQWGLVWKAAGSAGGGNVPRSARPDRARSRWELVAQAGASQPASSQESSDTTTSDGGEEGPERGFARRAFRPAAPLDAHNYSSSASSASVPGAAVDLDHDLPWVYNGAQCLAAAVQASNHPELGALLPVYNHVAAEKHEGASSDQPYQATPSSAGDAAIGGSDVSVTVGGYGGSVLLSGCSSTMSGRREHASWVRCVDMARVCILWLCGGVYVDTDAPPGADAARLPSWLLEPLEQTPRLGVPTPGVPRELHPVAVVPADPEGVLHNCWMAAGVPGHPLFGAVLRGATWTAVGETSPLEATGPVLLSAVLNIVNDSPLGVLNVEREGNTNVTSGNLLDTARISAVSAPAAGSTTAVSPLHFEHVGSSGTRSLRAAEAGGDSRTTLVLPPIAQFMVAQGVSLGSTSVPSFSGHPGSRTAEHGGDAGLLQKLQPWAAGAVLQSRRSILHLARTKELAVRHTPRLSRGSSVEQVVEPFGSLLSLSGGAESAVSGMHTRAALIVATDGSGAAASSASEQMQDRLQAHLPRGSLQEHLGSTVFVLPGSCVFDRHWRETVPLDTRESVDMAGGLPFASGKAVDSPTGVSSRETQIVQRGRGGRDHPCASIALHQWDRTWVTREGDGGFDGVQSAVRDLAGALDSVLGRAKRDRKWLDAVHRSDSALHLASWRTAQSVLDPNDEDTDPLDFGLGPAALGGIPQSFSVQTDFASSGAGTITSRPKGLLAPSGGHGPKAARANSSDGEPINLRTVGHIPARALSLPSISSFESLPRSSLGSTSSPGRSGRSRGGSSGQSSGDKRIESGRTAGGSGRHSRRSITGEPTTAESGDRSDSEGAPPARASGDGGSPSRTKRTAISRQKEVRYGSPTGPTGEQGLHGPVAPKPSENAIAWDSDASFGAHDPVLEALGKMPRSRQNRSHRRWTVRLLLHKHGLRHVNARNKPKPGITPAAVEQLATKMHALVAAQAKSYGAHAWLKSGIPRRSSMLLPRGRSRDRTSSSRSDPMDRGVAGGARRQLKAMHGSAESLLLHGRVPSENAIAVAPRPQAEDPARRDPSPSWGQQRRSNRFDEPFSLPSWAQQHSPNPHRQEVVEREGHKNTSAGWEWSSNFPTSPSRSFQKTAKLSMATDGNEPSDGAAESLEGNDQIVTPAVPGAPPRAVAPPVVPGTRLRLLTGPFNPRPTGGSKAGPLGSIGSSGEKLAVLGSSVAASPLELGFFSSAGNTHLQGGSGRDSSMQSAIASMEEGPARHGTSIRLQPTQIGALQSALESVIEEGPVAGNMLSVHRARRIVKAMEAARERHSAWIHLESHADADAVDRLICLQFRGSGTETWPDKTPGQGSVLFIPAGANPRSAISGAGWPVAADTAWKPGQVGAWIRSSVYGTGYGSVYGIGYGSGNSEWSTGPPSLHALRKAVDAVQAEKPARISPGGDGEQERTLDVSTHTSLDALRRSEGRLQRGPVPLLIAHSTTGSSQDVLKQSTWAARGGPVTGPFSDGILAAARRGGGHGHDRQLPRSAIRSMSHKHTDHAPSRRLSDLLQHAANTLMALRAQGHSRGYRAKRLAEASRKALEALAGIGAPMAQRVRGLLQRLQVRSLVD